MAKRIDVSDLDVYYGDFKAVEDVSMTIEPRSVTAFIGPSGCGKSTFLRTLNRMHEVIPGGRVEGKVMLDGQDLYAVDVDPVTVRRTVGMVFQRPNPFPTMSIYDNVAAGPAAQRGEEQEAARRDRRALAASGANLWNEVKDRLDKPGAGLSGGQQQRLCIARAIAVEPAGAADGRAVLGARPDLDAGDRGPDQRAEGRATRSSSSPTTCSRPPGSATAPRSSTSPAPGKPGRLVEIGDTAEDLHQPRPRRPPRTTSPAASADPPHPARSADCRSPRLAGGCTSECSHGSGGPMKRMRVVGERGDQGGGGDREDPGGHDVAGDAPAHGRTAAGRADAHDRGGDRVGGRDRGAEADGRV